MDVCFLVQNLKKTHIGSAERYQVYNSSNKVSSNKGYASTDKHIAYFHNGVSLV